MRFIADLHVHSKYSRATSRDLDLEHLWIQAQQKGITVVGTGDFTHGAWLDELESKLEPAEPGLYQLRPEIERALVDRVPKACRGPVRFALSTEISNIYSADGQVRKVHNLVLVPDLGRARTLREQLGRIGNVDSDGRPILGLDSRDLFEIVLELEGGAFLIPAHIWTPWFSVLGSKSGFDRVEDCYRDLARYIFAVETGLSSDPEMNWTCSFLYRYVLVSNSDAHSPSKLGREANVFDTELSYFAMRDALRGKEQGRFLGTIEFFPEEGKYHLDGHRKCAHVSEPADTVRKNGVCPVCGKLMTVGVMNRVYELADREIGERPAGAFDFKRQVPLDEVLGQRLQVGAASKRVAAARDALLTRLGPELAILSDLPLEDVRRVDPALAEGLARMRAGEVHVHPGYDGEFGVIDVFEPGEIATLSGQASLLDSVLPKRRGRSRAKRPAPSPDTEELPLLAEAAVPNQQADLFYDAGTRAACGEAASLDPEQRAAVRHQGGPLIVRAGPGAGKTRVLVERVRHLIVERRVPAGRVLALTFTQRAASELRQRVLARLQGRRGRPPRIEVQTFHSFCLGLLAEEEGQLPQLLDPDETEVLLSERLGVRSVARARRMISLFKQYMLATGEGLPDRGIAGTEEEWTAFAAYEAALEERGLRDLDDLVVGAARLLASDDRVRRRWRRRCEHLLIDEFQDVNLAQYELIRQLAPAEAEVVAIGDPDQAIYHFRGAEPRFFGRFVKDWPGAERVRLRANHRSSSEIVQAGGFVLGTEAKRLPTASGGPAGVPVTVIESASDKAEAEQVAHKVEELLGGVAHFSMDSDRVGGDGLPELTSFGDIAVLYRTHAQGLVVAEAISRLGLPVRRAGEVRAWRTSTAIRHFLSFARILLGGGRPFDFRQIVPPLGLAGGAVEDLPDMDREVFVALIQREAPERLAPVMERAPEEVAQGPAQDLVTAFLRLMEYRVSDEPEDPLRHLVTLVEEGGWAGAEVTGRIRTLEDSDLFSPKGDRIHLLTLHAAKGLEFPVVFVVGCDEGWIPLVRPGVELTADELAEERRLLYVGVTRARRALYLLHARRRVRHGKTIEVTRSRFLRGMEEEEDVKATTSRRKRKDGKQISLL